MKFTIPEIEEFQATGLITAPTHALLNEKLKAMLDKAYDYIEDLLAEVRENPDKKRMDWLTKNLQFIKGNDFFPRQKIDNWIALDVLNKALLEAKKKKTANKAVDAAMEESDETK